MTISSTIGMDRPVSSWIRNVSTDAGVHSALPDEAKRDDLVLSKLGAKAWGRLHEFRNHYMHMRGWGEGQGEPLSPRSLEGFYCFLEEAQFPEERKPSLFLTDQGFLELCWEDASGKAMHAEFTSGELIFFR